MATITFTFDPDLPESAIRAFPVGWASYDRVPCQGELVEVRPFQDLDKVEGTTESYSLKVAEVSTVIPATEHGHLTNMAVYEIHLVPVVTAETSEVRARIAP